MDAPCPPPARASVPIPAPPIGSVLVIHDDAGDSGVIANLLIGEGYAARTKRCDGMRLAEEIQPDIVLVNLALPKRTGLQRIAGQPVVRAAGRDSRPRAGQ